MSLLPLLLVLAVARLARTPLLTPCAGDVGDRLRTRWAGSLKTISVSFIHARQDRDAVAVTVPGHGIAAGRADGAAGGQARRARPDHALRKANLETSARGATKSRVQLSSGAGCHRKRGPAGSSRGRGRPHSRLAHLVCVGRSLPCVSVPVSCCWTRTDVRARYRVVKVSDVVFVEDRVSDHRFCFVLFLYR